MNYVAGFVEWVGKLREQGVKLGYKARGTSETYSLIKEVGLETLVWDSFVIKDKNRALRRTACFVEKYRPCLFIWDPLTDDLSKDYLFGVMSNDEIEGWVVSNGCYLHDYEFLITSQIINPGSGFVGSLFSDGLGNVVCETDHSEGVCDHRMLSRGKNDSENYDYFTSRCFEVYSVRGKFLSSWNVRDILNLFGHRKGYFEFVRGRQLGKTSFYTTGYESLLHFNFPRDFHESEDFSLGGRCFAVAMREGFL